MWNIRTLESTDRNTRFTLEEKGDTLTHQRFLELLAGSADFREYYNRLLADSGYEAFFWENKPVTDGNRDENYECNLIDTAFLASRNPDSRTFREYFDDRNAVVTFPSLGKDALLVVPCPRGEDSTYTHIGSFVRKAPKEQRDAFWKVAGREMLEAVGEEPRWLSTSGLGVFWLHARIDQRPKYYQTREYKRMN